MRRIVVHRAGGYERLVIELWTNGTITPGEALSQAATLLQDHLTIFIESEKSMIEQAAAIETTGPSDLDPILDKNIDELDLSVRSANCLKNASIHTLRDLVSRSEKEMLETRNFGRKSLEEVLEILEEHGLSFGMDVGAPENSGVTA